MKICFGCFEQYDDSFDICPHCGYAEGTEPELATYMRPGAILNERYVIGRALGHGGFSVTYLAWDALLLHKVAIKEYLPSEYATRRPGESRLTIFSGKEGEYFQFGKEKFLDEAKRLSAFQNEAGIVHVYDCFSANETAYLVISRRHHAERVSEKGSRRFAAGTDRAGRGYQYAHAGHAVAAACT